MREGSTPEQVIEIAQRALDMNDALGLSLSGGPLSWRGSARFDTGDLGGLDDYHRALDDAKKQGLSDDVAMILFNGSTVEFAVHGTARALEMQLECLEFSECHGIDYFSLAARALLVETYANLGHWSRAMQQAADVIPDVERAEDVIDLLLVRAHLLLLLSRTGRVDEAAGWIDWLEETGCGTEVVFLKMYAVLAVAEASCAMGQHDRALGLLEQWSALPGFHSEPASAVFVPGAVRAALECRQLELAERLVAAVEPNIPLRECVRLAGDGCLALDREGHAAALDCFARASAGWHRLGVPYEEAQALLGQGRCLVALGRAQEAAAPPRRGPRDLRAARRQAGAGGDGRAGSAGRRSHE